MTQTIQLDPPAPKQSGTFRENETVRPYIEDTYFWPRQIETRHIMTIKHEADPFNGLPNALAKLPLGNLIVGKKDA